MYKERQLKETKRRFIMRKYNIKWKDEILPVIKKLKQQLQAKSQRIRRCDKRKKFFIRITHTKTMPKMFYRELGKKNVIIRQIPEKESVESL